MKAKKIMAVLVIAIMLIGIVSVPVLASTNEKVILKNSDNEYLIQRILPKRVSICNQQRQQNSRSRSKLC